MFLKYIQLNHKLIFEDILCYIVLSNICQEKTLDF